MSRDLTRLEVCQRYVAGIRHSAMLGMEVLEANAQSVRVRLPWQEMLVGNPATGVIHGGAIFTLMDQSGGLANACALFPEFEITPTIDMRVDHLRAPGRGQAIVCDAQCHRQSRQVMFVRMSVYEEGDKTAVVATSLATYMRMKLKQTATVETLHGGHA